MSKESEPVANIDVHEVLHYKHPRADVKKRRAALLAEALSLGLTGRSLEDFIRGKIPPPKDGRPVKKVKKGYPCPFCGDVGCQHIYKSTHKWTWYKEAAP